MSAAGARVFSIPSGAAFLPTLADALLDGTLVGDLGAAQDPLRLADVTLYVPTRRAARQLRGLFADRAGGAAILPTILPLGDVDEDAGFFDESVPPPPDIHPPVGSLERVLALAPLVQRWKQRLPAHVAALFAEPVVVPSSTAEAVWLARDLAQLMDEVETAEASWTRLSGLVERDLAAWWQVTLEFLDIVTQYWPAHLAAIQRSNPGAHRSSLIDRETARLRNNPPRGPVIAAGSTGSIPATARLLDAIARLPNGAVVLPGLDRDLDAASWQLLGDPDAMPAICGHPQFGLHRLVGDIGIARADVVDIGVVSPMLAARARLMSEALRPAESTDAWAEQRGQIDDAIRAGALDGLTLIEAPNERDEALAIATALRLAVDEPDRTAALVTADRNLARRVSAELLRFGIDADDSAGTQLSSTPPATFLTLLVEAALRPGDPVSILSALKHPLLTLGLERAVVRRAVETIELAALRGGTGRPDIAALLASFDERSADERTPGWLRRLSANDFDQARDVMQRLARAVLPLTALRGPQPASLALLARATVEMFDNAGRSADGGLAELYRGEAGEKLADMLRELVATTSTLDMAVVEWPDVLGALIAGQAVKPRAGADRRVSIWGGLEARMQSVDTLVCGGLNEGTWPAKADPGAFMSRVMKAGIALDPPERRIGQAAHDFAMAMGGAHVILSRSARSGDAPAVASRWLQRLTVLVGEQAAAAVRQRGAELLAIAHKIANDTPDPVAFAPRPAPTPPLAARPTHFSVTEIETLRRDPYAIYARKILQLDALEPLLRDPGAAERGSLFHAILHRFTEAVGDPDDAGAAERLLEIARACFDEERLPPDIDAVWWPRFRAMAPNILAWERECRTGVQERLAEASADATPIDGTGVTLGGRADRIDLRPSGMADILDYKTGSTPRKRDAHLLVAPQLSLEAALLQRGAFKDAGRRQPAELAYVRLRATGGVDEESILTFNRAARPADALAGDAWERLIRLMFHYGRDDSGYRSRALPFRSEATDGDYDHLARVLEWSAGGDGDGEEGGE